MRTYYTITTELGLDEKTTVLQNSSISHSANGKLYNAIVPHNVRVSDFSGRRVDLNVEERPGLTVAGNQHTHTTYHDFRRCTHLSSTDLCTETEEDADQLLDSLRRATGGSRRAPRGRARARGRASTLAVTAAVRPGRADQAVDEPADVAEQAGDEAVLAREAFDETTDKAEDLAEEVADGGTEAGGSTAARGAGRRGAA